MHAPLSWDPPKSNSEIRTWVKVVHLEDDFHKHKWGVVKWEREWRKGNKEWINKQVTPLGPWGSILLGTQSRIITLKSEENWVFFLYLLSFIHCRLLLGSLNPWLIRAGHSHAEHPSPGRTPFRPMVWQVLEKGGHPHVSPSYSRPQAGHQQCLLQC